MAGDAADVADMRGGADRALGFAVLASLVLHALALAALPSLQKLVVEVARAPLPLVARIAQPAAEPLVQPVAKPAPPAERPAVRKPAVKTAPAPLPLPLPLPLPVQPPVVESAPAPAAPVTPAAPGPAVRLEPVPAPTPAAPPPDLAGAQEGYRVSLNIAAARFKRYPRAAIDNGWEGEVVLLLSIGADGRIAALRVKTGSGYEILDRQALDMFRNAKPFVPVPRALQGREFEIELRAIYSLKDQGSG